MLPILDGSCSHVKKQYIGAFFSIETKSMLETEPLQRAPQGQIHVTDFPHVFTLPHTLAVSPTVKWNHRRAIF